jgi:outer membrane protein assembly factor BamB
MPMNPRNPLPSVRRFLGGAFLAVAVVAVSKPKAAAADWPQWRGPAGDGISAETGLPLRWSEDDGVLWKVELPGWGSSTPAVWGGAVFVTAEEGEQLQVLRLDARTGDLVWKKAAGQGSAGRMELRIKGPDERKQQKFHRDHNLASPSPVVDGERVIAHFGNGDLASFRFDGALEWKRNLQEDHGAYTIWWGHANSPVLHEDLVVSVCMQDSLGDLQEKLSPSYLVAHEKATGKERWKTMRMTGAASEPCDSYVTPVFRKGQAGLELVLMGGTWLDAYDPRSGRQLWKLPDLGGNRVITGPVVAGGTIYATIGMRGHLLAVDPKGAGDLGADAVRWRHREGTPDSPCPVVANDHVFIVSDNGIARCLDAGTGETRWTERLEGDYRASLFAAEGRVWFLSTRGLTTIVEAAPAFKKLAESRLDDAFFASPAASGGRVYLRGKKRLYCVGEP